MSSSLDEHGKEDWEGIILACIIIGLVLFCTVAIPLLVHYYG